MGDHDELDVEVGEHPSQHAAVAQVEQRRRDGLTNDVPDRASRSVRDIVRANVFTRINAILGVLFL
ncbi:hypothetical protein KC221_31285, partial [Mycobacterium tuberculosis]|nr:hypothetical protein [Mycobacterium tuberculosis]